VDLPRFAAERVVASTQAQHMMWLQPDRTDNWSVRPRRRARLAAGAPHRVVVDGEVVFRGL
jgi:hypothetical protein